MSAEKGMRAKAEKIVEAADTAKAVGSGSAMVFSTPSMIALMERAACEAVRGSLPEGCSTVGTAINVKHIAATVVGAKVRAQAELTEADGKKLRFFIEAFDETEKIGEAEHTRYIVDDNKFMSKAAAKGKDA